ncbi:rhomboid family intramembrane serine protease [Flavobacterium tegetincola]|uniref:rhomboid family intramembrane serine protease n=1 Tax=Flavobacterium tegetincola TaxID=150172 RepID=UPI0004232FEA|nr:rhomboid family intramembrane serine protease [Flavobacterium tegetincola]
MNENHFKFSLSVVVLPLLFILSIWTVYWFEIRFDYSLSEFGIYPRTFEGFRGVFFSPFLHGSIEHLYSNTIPAFSLMASLRYFYRENFWKVLGYGILISGILTWLIGRESYHIGASGLIYVLVSFMFFKGIRSQYYRLVALSLVIIMLYGGMIWYVFPDIEDGISWEGHLAGLITGFAMALIFKTPDYKKFLKYDWEQPEYTSEGDKFMDRFDENGVFVNPPKPIAVEEVIEVNPDQHSTANKEFIIVYHFKQEEE